MATLYLARIPVKLAVKPGLSLPVTLISIISLIVAYLGMGSILILALKNENRSIDTTDPMLQPE
jgi:hypothetical protein